MRWLLSFSEPRLHVRVKCCFYDLVYIDAEYRDPTSCRAKLRPMKAELSEMILKALDDN